MVSYTCSNRTGVSKEVVVSGLCVEAKMFAESKIDYSV